MKGICSDNVEYENSNERLVNSALSSGFNKDKTIKQMKRVDSTSREDILQPNARKNPIHYNLNRTALPLGRLLHKNWNILNVNSKIVEAVTKPLIVAYKRNRNLRDILGSNRILTDEVVKSTIQNNIGFVGHIMLSKATYARRNTEYVKF